MSDNNEIIDIEEIIAIVAKKQKLLLSEDDPVLTTAILNDAILQKYLFVFNKQLASLKTDLQEIYDEQERQADKVVRTVMKQCLEAARESLEQSAKKASEDIKTALRTQQNVIEARNEKIYLETKMNRNIALFSALASLGVALFFAIIFWF